jgi:hypothetical protein
VIYKIKAKGPECNAEESNEEMQFASEEFELAASIGGPIRDSAVDGRHSEAPSEAHIIRQY